MFLPFSHNYGGRPVMYGVGARARFVTSSVLHQCFPNLNISTIAIRPYLLHCMKTTPHISMAVVF